MIIINIKLKLIKIHIHELSTIIRHFYLSLGLTFSSDIVVCYPNLILLSFLWKLRISIDSVYKYVYEYDYKFIEYVS